MVPFSIRFSFSLFFRRTSFLVVLSLTASFFLNIFVGSIAGALERRWFCSISLAVPPICFGHHVQQNCDVLPISIFSDIPFPPVPISREPVVCDVGKLSREAIAINVSPNLDQLKDGELLVPRSWSGLKVGDLVVLSSLKDESVVERKITGVFYDIPGLTNDMVLTKWESKPTCWAFFVPPQQIRFIASILKKNIPNNWYFSTLEDHPIYGGWLQEILHDHFLISCLKMALLYVGVANTCFAAVLLLSQSCSEIALIQMMGGDCCSLLFSFLFWIGECFFISFPLAIVLGFLSIEWWLKRSFFAKKCVSQLALLKEVNSLGFLNDIQLEIPSVYQMIFFVSIVSLVVSMLVIFFSRKGPERILRDGR
ncbi:hypothetical protein [Candidatus Similichlamydia epinepheli]|uniref:hypothetical protein n=1 Tax=Candidatus Similichlamydia epinepheli TaxID=1903953 RepID=UPI000D34F2A5|nr:hypothetical protein [Candidatus Similichlamydia epinepheli]